ncbi:putative glycogen debranching enzyme Gdb1 [Coemansia reversa NRRL 1564]|uniref:Glycogen debranching enzyme n=1 Tax=Coemansia reversa (strain ATCC 12441 / NRRL 1564) TaxID=763665 RepID=A0A2G5BCI4_COERN|nr:putative glycogen debranching enzyme Gdb1 [Coemansia reversa NRRL 1564]|eukprot:PIA16729.1 putative glycogen debranching enzyme Gdb1 [Coemansia reversa NRRL 1564]
MARFSTPDQPDSPPFMVWNLDLNEDGTTPREKSFIRIPSSLNQTCAIRFRLLIGSTASIGATLHTNYPLDGSDYERTKFHPKKFNFNNQTEQICEFRIQRPGPYQYYVSYKSLDADADADDNCDSISCASDVNPLLERIYRAFEDRRSPTAYFLVDPQLTLSGQTLPLDGIVLQSVSPKWLGLMSNWSPHLAASSKMGYNMMHFIPMQQRGGSDSPYSLCDQLELSDDLFENPLGRSEKDAKLRETLLEMKHRHKLLGVTDMVWNHTAFNSDWLSDHPEAGFNLENSPHLRSAYELDEQLAQFSRNLSDYGLDRMVHSVVDVDRLMDGVSEHVVQPMRLWEFYTIDVEAAIESVSKAWDKISATNVTEEDKMTLETLSGDARTEWLHKYMINGQVHTLGTRFGRKIDPERTAAVMHLLVGGANKEEAMKQLRKLLDLLNLPYYREYDSDVQTICKNIRERVLYERLDNGSWKFGKPVDDNYKIVDPLFTTVKANSDKVLDDQLHLANNGWIWGGNPLDNFAGPQSKAYLLREVIVWGDCVKLNYGTSPEDNPWLWEHMRQYTLNMARAFHGFRIDNCHSTPIELAEYLLDEARKINPNLYVIAELFTGSEDTDRIFVQRLGINSLIREAMQAWDSHEMSRLAHRHGGRPIGSLALDCLGEPGFFTDDEHGGARVNGIVAPLSASLPHAIFFDCTHDNQVPAQKRTMEDALPNTAIVAMTACATGSNRGYDELYPQHLNVVHEHRHYAVLQNPLTVGLGVAKAKLNQLHREMAQYEEVHVHHENEYVTVHRVHPVTREGVLMIAHCAFPGATENAPFEKPRLYGTMVEPEFAFRLRSATENHDGDERVDKDVLQGLPSSLETLNAPGIYQHTDERGVFAELELPQDFGPGSVLVVRTRLVGFKPNLDWKIRTCADEAVAELSLGELNIALYRCDAEEHDTIGDGVYNVPGLGPLPYCGIQGWCAHLKYIIPNNDLGHPLCEHLRQGTWALDYISGRLHKHSKLYPHLTQLAAWFDERWELVRHVPNFLLPRYFALTVHTANQALLQRALKLMPGDVVCSSRFTNQLALTSVQLLGYMQSAGLRPRDTIENSMSAGLPHFSTHHMRCWGRDVFVALDGLLLATGRFDDARNHILAFGSTLKHGLIPNLLDAGRFPRYNARDATWYWLQAAQMYCKQSPEGTAFLEAKVARRFPDGETFVPWDSDEAFSCTSTIAELVQEIMDRHARGISFREWNAGPSLDEHMRDEGFNISISVDFAGTGFVSGGNQWNCGTWMDKMGSSDKAGIRGVPGSPRDGAAIEIVGLQKSALRWLTDLYSNSEFAYEGVTTADGSHVSYSDWNQQVQIHFEKHFWVPLDSADDTKYNVDSTLVNRRGIYRDSVGASAAWADYQFRPNIPIAMTAAPELFDPRHAIVCLHKIGAVLAGPMGMRTLDPSDMRYRPNYDNSDDSDDPLVAQGINYHQGPEWLWLTGHYLRALLLFLYRIVRSRSADYNHELTHALRTVYHELHARMVTLKHHISTSPYAGLPELTNKDGSHCRDSCETQAWSSGCLLMCLHQIMRLEILVHEALEADKYKEN